MTHVTCRLTAKNRDLLQNPTLGNRATFLLHNHHTAFYPRDAMLHARVLAMARCLSVPVLIRCSIKMTLPIKLVFGTKASFDLSYAVL